jgi:hypothetical protein
MNEYLDKASYHLTGKENLSEVTTEDLEKLANEYPYFSVSQVLLAKKYKAEAHSNFLPQVQKAALYYNNPYWLHYQLLDVKPEISLNDENVEHEEIINVESEGSAQKETPYLFAPDEQLNTKAVLNKNEIDAATILAKETLASKNADIQKDTDQEEIEITPDEMHPETEEVLEDISEQQSEVDEELSGEDESQIPVESEDIQEATNEISTEALNQTVEEKEVEETISEKDLIATVVENTLVQPVSIDETIEKSENKDVQNESLTEAIRPTVEETEPENSIAGKDLIATVVENTLVQPVSIDDNIEQIEPLPSVLDEVSMSNYEYAQTNSSLDKPQEAAATPPNNEPLIPIEPYYTVDYFASQGIKLVLDKNPQDRLGKQLRSFTDWLKHMKKLGPEDALKATQDAEVDTTIKDIADTSNTQKEIITEAMADVLIKQKKYDQAIEVYNKLSFLNPDKSTYFADQIKKLKGT